MIYPEIDLGSTTHVGGVLQQLMMLVQISFLYTKYLLEGEY
jgi:hypothetical protein